MRLKKKTSRATEFIDGLHDFVVAHPQFRKKTKEKSESQIQTELRPLIIDYLERYYTRRGYKDCVAKANKSFYWEGQEGRFGRARTPTFAARNYPDFVITDPYLIAVEYKQSANGSLVKQLMGQSLMHTLCEDFEYVYCLFHDQSAGKKILKSSMSPTEAMIIGAMWSEFNVRVRFI